MAWNPPACRRVWLEGVVLVSVLGLYLFLCCCAFLLRLNQVHPPSPSDAYSFLLLPQVHPSAKLVVPVANDTAYNIAVVYRYSSQDAHGTNLIDQCSFGMRSIGCSSRHVLLKLLLIYGSVFVSSSSSSSYSLLFCFSLRLPPSVRINFPWGNLSLLPPCTLSPSMQRSAVKPKVHT